MAGFTPPLAAQNASDSVRSLDSAWARAYAEHDTVLARALFADSLVVTSGNGKLKDREGEVADVRPAAGFVLHYFRTSDVVVRVYGSSSVVIGLAEWSYTYQGNTPPTTRRRYTAVYVSGGTLGWHMVALHIGPAPELSR